ncbi:MAG: hypothetical protein HRT71_14740 [Flavobacteriales bacterium]|nr:hypothetical protein [Flavobacteriales bacterium]
MKYLLFVILVIGSLTASAQDTEKKTDEAEMQIVEVSCGQCKFGLEGDGCDLAINIDGKKYWVDGTTMDEHGDAHGHGGMCNTIRKAKVKGELVDGRYKVTEMELLPDEHNHKH